MYQDGGDNLATGYMIGRDNGGYGNGFFGGDWAWIIILALLFGWGNNGNGFGGGFGGGNGFLGGYDIGKLATTNDVAVGFNNSAVLSSLNDLKLGQAGLQQTLCQGFNGVNTSILTSTNAVQSQLAGCCCDLARSIDGVNYNMAKNTSDIIQANNANTQRIIDTLTQNEITSLRTELQSAQLQLSNFSQTQNIVNQLRPCPVPAYITCSPYTSYNFNPYNYNNCGCGCGCGC